MPIFAKHVKALSDQDYEKKVDLQWTRALATWLAILEGSRFDSLVGYHVQERLFQQDREGALVVIRDACGVRSPNTVLKRGRDLQLFFSWAESNRGQWWPIKELHLLEYVRWTEKKQKSNLIGKNLQHGLKFFKYVMGAQFNLENLITPLMTGLVSRIASTKAVVDQARALTVVEIQNLEHNWRMQSMHWTGTTSDACSSQFTPGRGGVTWRTWTPSTSTSSRPAQVPLALWKEGAASIRLQRVKSARPSTCPLWSPSGESLQHHGV